MNVASVTGKAGTILRKIEPLDVVTKGAGVLAALSVLSESNSIGVLEAEEKSKVYEADKAVRLGIGTGKLNYQSPKYNKIKEFIYNNCPYGVGKVWNGFKGYLEGFMTGAVNNIATLGFSALAIVSKHKPVKIASLVGLLGSIGFNFLQHGTNLFEKTDQLE